MKHLLQRILCALVLCFSALPALADVEIEEVVSEGGIKAWLVEDHRIPFVALELRFRGGTTLDQPGKRGATALMMALLEEGAGDLDAVAFSRAREDLAVSFRYDSSPYSASVSARFLSADRDEAVDLLRLSLMQPSFAPDAVERVRGQILSIQRDEAKAPNSIASHAFNAAAYGGDQHPYGTNELGTPETVNALTREDLVAAHKGVLSKDRLYVSAVGDITPQELQALLDHLLGDLPETGFAPAPATAFDAPGGVHVTPFDTPQSVAVFGHKGIARDHPDFMPAYVLATIMGGSGFESRLMEEVREKRGLTYGIYVYLSSGDLGQVIVGRVASANARMGETIKVVQEEWARMAREGVSAEELADAKTRLTGAYPLRFDGNASIANILVGMQMDNLPITYVKNRNALVNAITLEEINALARKLFHPDNLHWQIVGNPEGVQE